MNQIRLRHAILYILMMLFIIPASAQSTAGSSIASRTLLVSDGTNKYHGVGSLDHFSDLIKCK
jgi:hypothetical protein